MERDSVDGLDDHSENPLLHEKTDIDGQTQIRRKSLRRWMLAGSMHLVIFLMYTALFVSIHQQGRKEVPRQHIPVPYSPANDAVWWRKQLIDSTHYHKTPYSGNPSPEVDHAWNQLTSGFNLRVSRETLDRINRTSIPLSDGSGYIAGWDTTHQLHCLLSIRHALAPEYYAEEIATLYKPDGEVYPTHISHCIELLRETLMCKADGSLFTYAWDNSKPEPLTNFAVEHTCVDWERLRNWSVENSFRLHDDLLVHPKFGKWPNGGPV